MSEDLDSSSFNKNYKILKETADWLSQQGEPDIDQLVPKVEKAMQAYRVCKERLNKVQTTLEQCLQNDEVGESPQVPAPSQDGDDDIPF